MVFYCVYVYFHYLSISVLFINLLSVFVHWSNSVSPSQMFLREDYIQFSNSSETSAGCTPPLSQRQLGLVPAFLWPLRGKAVRIIVEWIDGWMDKSSKNQTVIRLHWCVTIYLFVWLFVYLWCGLVCDHQGDHSDITCFYISNARLSHYHVSYICPMHWLLSEHTNSWN